MRTRLLAWLQMHRAASALVALFVALAVLNSLVAPVFEVSDEYWHYPVVQHIATTGELPVQRPGVETAWEQQGSQPPLYYLISAGLTAWIDTRDMLEVRWQNPHAKVGIPGDFDNKNMVIHTDAEAFPWRGTVLAIHLIRFFSVTLGTGSVILSYLLAQELWPGQRTVHLLGTAIMAFNPMFLHIAGSVNNDNLTILFGSWILLLAVRLIRHGITPRRAITLAVVSALATITKISGATFMLAVGLSLLVHGLSTRRWREVVLTGFAVTVAWLALAGWWYLRNIRLYGEFLGIETHVAVAGGRSIGLVQLLTTEWYGFWAAYWGWFGGVTILAWGWLYAVSAVLTFGGLAGACWWAAQELRAGRWRSLLPHLIITVQVITVFVSLIQWTMKTFASQGRLMFPVLAAISTLTAWGLLWWLPQHWRRAIAGAVMGGMAMVALAIPVTVIAPAFAPPRPVASLPEGAIPVGARWNELELVAIQTEAAIVRNGDTVPVITYWRLLEPTTVDYSIALTALGRDASPIGKIDSYPGGGTLPTSLMRPGEIIADRYRIRIDRTAAAPSRIRVQIGVGLLDDGTYHSLEAQSATGDMLPPVITEAGVAYPADRAACLARPPAATSRLADVARVTASVMPQRAHPGEPVAITLAWYPLRPTAAAQTVFMQLVTPDGQIAAQADRPPLNGDYPTTLWQRPCPFDDTYTLAIPASLSPGSYTILFGLYDAADPAYPRLGATDPNGTPYPNAAVHAGTVEVLAP